MDITELVVLWLGASPVVALAAGAFIRTGRGPSATVTTLPSAAAAVPPSQTASTAA